MKLNAKVEEALNQKINSELLASYTYLAMAAYFDGEELPGFATWFKAHSVEETALKMEKQVTQQIHSLFEISNTEKEYGTQNMLQWFLEEQVEEEDLFRHVLSHVPLLGGYDEPETFS